MNDWSDLCAMDDDAIAGRHHVSACHPAPEDSVVTPQYIENNKENGTCNHITTVTTQDNMGGDFGGVQSYARCHNDPLIGKPESSDCRGIHGAAHDMLHKPDGRQGIDQGRGYPLRPTKDVVWYLESNGEGWDCQFCAHLVSRWEYAENSRRRFNWRCSQGHSVMEYGQGSERILLAPESCQEWSRFVPGESKRAFVKEDPRRPR